jgi:hypothetical protein
MYSAGCLGDYAGTENGMHCTLHVFLVQEEESGYLEEYASILQNLTGERF